MKIIVGSINPVKVSAVQNAIRDHAVLGSAELTSHDSHSGVSEQPLHLEIMVSGAHNRAQHAYTTNPQRDSMECMGVGIESGVFPLGLDKKEGVFSHLIGARPFIMAVCTLFDGKKTYDGLSPLVECPTFIFDYMIKHKVTLDDAVFQLGLTEDQRIGVREGIIYHFTRGRMTRLQQLEIAVSCAIARWEERELYTRER